MPPRPSSRRSAAPPRSAWVTALAALARRDLSEGEVRVRLRDREVPEDEVEDVVDRLRERRYVDDATLAREVAGRAARRRLHGPARVAALLRRRRFPDDLIEDAVRAAFADDAELEGAREALSRMRERRNPPDRAGERRRLYGRGFSPSVIREAIARAEAPS